MVDEPWDERERPRVDALVTQTPGSALGVLTADCAPVLFADPQGGVIGAAHAGWKGALAGVTEATLDEMEEQGGHARNITAVIGPMISQAAYEVGPEFPARFIERSRRMRRFFTPSAARGPLPCSTCRPISRTGCEAEGVGTVVNLVALHLRRRGALLQLPPHHTSRRNGLRPPDLGHRTRPGTDAWHCISNAPNIDRRIAGRSRRWQAQGLDGLLMFQQESMYYLTGYDTFGFCFFQCLYLGADGKLALLTRSADLRQAQHTSIIEDIRIWTDAAGAKPADQLRDMLESLGARGKRLGVENQSYGLTHFNGKALEAALDGFAQAGRGQRPRQHDPPGEVAGRARIRPQGRRARRRGAEGGGRARPRPGADEGEILAAQQAAVFAGGGDYPANEFIIGSGRDALLCRYKSGRRKLAKRDQLTLEWAGVYRHYHAAFMRTLIIGEPTKRHVAMHAAARAALAACEEEMQARPHGGRGVRRPCPRHGRAWHEGAPAQCLRLFAGRQVHAVLDGQSDVLPGQSGGDRARHGVLRPHDPDELGSRSSLLPRPHLHHRG